MVSELGPAVIAFIENMAVIVMVVAATVPESHSTCKRSNRRRSSMSSTSTSTSMGDECLWSQVCRARSKSTRNCTSTTSTISTNTTPTLL